MKHARYVVLQKEVGETPLSCVEAYRARHAELHNVPLAYAGRLDPLASGALLVLIGYECKQQKKYHGLDKEYVIEVVFGIGSDTGDVMGRLTPEQSPTITDGHLQEIATQLSNSTLSLPYPAFSSKTVQGKPLHTWAVEGRLHEIEIPTQIAPLYDLKFLGMRTLSAEELAEQAIAKMNTIPPVTELRKAIGNDFRRDDIRADWKAFAANFQEAEYTIATFRIRAGSGMYMRTLANEIATRFDTRGLCLSIHRSKIGTLHTLFGVNFFRNL